MIYLSFKSVTLFTKLQKQSPCYIQHVSNQHLLLFPQPSEDRSMSTMNGFNILQFASHCKSNNPPEYSKAK